MIAQVEDCRLLSGGARDWTAGQSIAFILDSGVSSPIGTASGPSTLLPVRLLICVSAPRAFAWREFPAAPSDRDDGGEDEDHEIARKWALVAFDLTVAAFFGLAHDGPPV